MKLLRGRLYRLPSSSMGHYLLPSRSVGLWDWACSCQKFCLIMDLYSSPVRQSIWNILFKFFFEALIWWAVVHALACIENMLYLL